ncbi:hypothetical protein INT45_004872 [Circinella minor]|uniref:Uncharacterized protein n=1 Tax=Circinella minor TaxID=1195481 RepID=A0A8H7RUR9_9FUNG|nr:hypothetical protein INT45_004872 [Circinella minor]
MANNNKDTNPVVSNNKVSYRSYAQVTKGHWIHHLSANSPSGVTLPDTILNSTPEFTPVFRHGSEEYSVFYDLTYEEADPTIFHNQARQSFPIGYEVVLNSEQACQQAYAKPLQLSEMHSIPVFWSLLPDQEVTRVGLSQLPILSCHELESRLYKCLSQYSKILQLGLYEEPNGRWFGSRGFVVLSKTVGKDFVTLEYRMHWGTTVHPDCRCFNCDRLEYIASACLFPMNLFHHKKSKLNSGELASAKEVLATSKSKASTRKSSPKQITKTAQPTKNNIPPPVAFPPVKNKNGSDSGVKKISQHIKGVQPTKIGESLEKENNNNIKQDLSKKDSGAHSGDHVFRKQEGITTSPPSLKLTGVLVGGHLIPSDNDDEDYHASEEAGRCALSLL